MWPYHNFLIPSSADGHLGRFHVLADVNSAAMNIGVLLPLYFLVYLVCIPTVGVLGHIQPVYFQQNVSTWRFQGMERPPRQLSIMPGLYLWHIVMLCRNKYQHIQAWQSSPSIHLLPKTGSVGCNHWFINLKARGSYSYLKVLSLPLILLPLACFRCQCSFPFLPCKQFSSTLQNVASLFPIVFSLRPTYWKCKNASLCNISN